MGVTVLPSSSFISKNMPFKSFLLIILTLYGASGISLRLPTTFESKVRVECYKLDMRAQPYPLGQQLPGGPVGNSMENFISLIEKIEDYMGRNVHRPDILARIILSRFHIDDIVYYPLGQMFHQETQASTRNRITEAMLNAAESNLPEFPEDSLNSDEKCSLYFMLSHSINQTALPGDRRVYMANPRAPEVYPSTSLGSGTGPGRQALNSRFKQTVTQTQAITPQVRLTEDAREQGVVGFRNHYNHAIAPAKVLLGIIAANLPSLEISTVELNRLVQTHQEPLPEVKEALLNIPLMATLGEVWAYGATPSFNGIDRGGRIGAKGEWNSTLCQINYRLEHNSTRASLAEIRGAIDGYLLGKKTAEVLKDGVNFKLSSLMRQYYSTSGLFDEYISVCYRERIQNDISNLKEQVKSYIKVWHPLIGITMNEGQQNNLVDMSSREFEEALRIAQEKDSEETNWCRPQRLDTGTNPAFCETKSDVVIVADMEGDVDQQMEIVRRVSNELDMRRYGSSITLLANTKGGGSDGFDGLSRIAWNTTNRGCANCRFAWMDRNNFGYGFRNTPDILYRAANNSLRDLKEGSKDQVFVNGRPLVLFNYGSVKRPSGDRRAFDSAQYDMKYSHRDVPFIMVGPPSETENMKTFAYDDKNDIFTLDPDVSGITQRLVKRICETPAAVQHPRCRQETSNGVTFSGFVSKGKKQYWAMYPEYFLKSYNVAFEIKAINGPIKVCYRRGYPKPEEDERNCEKLDPSSKSSHILRSANPCYKYDLYNCPPFFFTIIGLNEGTTANTKCKSK